VTSPQTQDEMQGRLLLDIVVTESASVFELLSGKDETLLIRGNAFLILDLGLDVVDRIRRFNVKCDGLSRQSLDEDLSRGYTRGEKTTDKILSTSGHPLFGCLQAVIVRGSNVRACSRPNR